MIEIRSMVRQKGWPHISIETSLRPPDSHYFVADGLPGFLKALAWKWLIDGKKGGYRQKEPDHE